MAEAAGLYYETHGPAGAPPLILSSGLGGSASYWQPNLTALAEHHRVVVYDHRGTGRSERQITGEVSLEAMARDMIALLDSTGTERATVVGHAVGGMAGLALALSAPERVSGVVVVNGWARLDPHTARCFDTRLALLRDSGVAAFLHAQPLFLFPPDWVSAHHDRLVAEAAEQKAHFAGSAMVERRIAAAQAFDIADRLGEIATAVLVIATADDMLVPPSASALLAAGLPNATLARLPGGGHAVNVTQPDRFAATVLPWLASPGE